MTNLGVGNIRCRERGDLVLTVQNAIESFRGENGDRDPDTAIIYSSDTRCAMDSLDPSSLKLLFDNAITVYSVESLQVADNGVPTMCRVEDYGLLAIGDGARAPRVVLRKIRALGSTPHLLLSRRGWAREFGNLAAYTLDSSCATGVGM